MVDIVGTPENLGQKRDSRQRLAHLYERYQTDICKYVGRTFGDGPPDPEDVAQQVFVKFVELDEKTDIKNPRAYLYRIAHNLIANLHRKASTRRRYIADQKNTGQALESDTIHPERILIARERLALLEQVMWAMPVKRRRMIILNWFQDLTYAEISRQTGVSKSVVRKHVLNGLEDFQKALRKQHAQEQGELDT
ncbi:MAG: sigma-70 family RNA polymerase sigma factor [Kordiimonadaceae bacterium]|nr:sigma-70 family RNA polymerase sigma factor [Kordiimonadaceae bacterium]